MSGEGFTILGFTISIFSLIGFILSEIIVELKKRKIKKDLYGGDLYER